MNDAGAVCRSRGGGVGGASSSAVPASEFAASQQLADLRACSTQWLEWTLTALKTARTCLTCCFCKSEHVCLFSGVLNGS